MSKNNGSLIGGILLIGGSCVGAGMLALPIITGLCGFKLSLIIFFVSWAFMTSTGLLLVEINVGLKKTDVDFPTIIEHFLGPWFRKAGWLLYLFLFYSLLVAYLVGIGTMLSAISDDFGLNISVGICSIIVAICIGIILCFQMKVVDFCNRIFMVGKIIAYISMVSIGIFWIKPNLLHHSEFKSILASLPIMVVSFGFHNLIPTITKYMDGDIKKVKQTVIFGSLFTLFIYILWDFIVLGIVPKEGEFGILESFKHGRDASVAISRIIKNSYVANFAECLAFFSFLTSILLQSLALSSFLKDGFRNKFNKYSLIIITLCPPLIFSICYPTIFFKALDFAGGFCAVILFGVFPVLMALRGYWNNKQKIISNSTILSKQVLMLIMAFAVFVVLFQLKGMLM